MKEELTPGTWVKDSAEDTGMYFYFSGLSKSTGKAKIKGYIDTTDDTHIIISLWKNRWSGIDVSFDENNLQQVNDSEQNKIESILANEGIVFWADGTISVKDVQLQKRKLITVKL